MFFIIVFVVLITYIASFGYRKKYKPLKLNAFQYSITKGQEETPSLSELTYASELSQCQPGYCAIDKSSGFKRCPENTTNKLVYNIVSEACTRINFCDYQKLPYAVKTDGSASDNMCEQSPSGELVACRCTNNPTCSNHVLSKYIITNGSENQGTPKDFQIIQEATTEQDANGYFNIPLDNQSSEFCQVNPGFTNIVVNGCNFQNSIQDKLDCSNISSINIGLGDSALAWKLEKGVSVGDTSFTLVTNYDINSGIRIEPNGLLTFVEQSGDGDTTVVNRTETIKYGRVGNIIENITADNKTLTITDVVSVRTTQEGDSTNDSVPAITGFSSNWEADKTAITISDSSFVFCSVPNEEPNWKNMLLCTQNDKEVCKYGTFSYNYDRLRNQQDSNIVSVNETFTRNFCQLNPTRDPGLFNNDYLTDPAYYTLSCSIGDGCNGKNFSKNANQESIAKFFPDVDINAINGQWGVSTALFPRVFFNDDTQLLNENTVQPGDFWSIKIINQNLVTGNQVTQPGTSIVVQNVFGLGEYINNPIPSNSELAPGVCFGTSSRQLVEAFYTNENGKNVAGICVTPAINFTLEPFSTIRIAPPNIRSEETYGIITIDETQAPPPEGVQNYSTKYYLKTLDGSSISPKSFEGIEIQLSIYKQFSFSGGNYVTKLMNDVTGNKRIYTQGDGTSYQIIINQNTMIPVTPPKNIYELSFTSERELEDIDINFYSPQAPFKVPLSMYYPVWNSVLFQQECVRCKPLLVAFPELDAEGLLSNIIIQFCGQDFKNYQYNFRDKNYCYTNIAELDFDNPQKTPITTRTLVLKEPNLNVNIGDYVLDSSLQLEYDIIPTEGVLNTLEYDYLQLVPQVFPSFNSINDFKGTFDEIGNSGTFSPSTYPFSFGLDESDSVNVVYDNSTFYPNQRNVLSFNKGKNSWEFDSSRPQPLNYFFGKKYQDSKKYNRYMADVVNNRRNNNKLVYTDGFYFIPSQKVTSISADRLTITVESDLPRRIIQGTTPTYVQFCRLDSPLKIKVTNEAGTEFQGSELKINSICDGRITDILIEKNDQRYLQSNPPLISIDTGDQNFIS